MPIYLLIPLRTSESVWSFAARRDPVQVVARNEQEARIGASMRFGLRARAPGSESPDSADPWLDSAWTYVHTIDEEDPGLPIIKWPNSDGASAPSAGKDKPPPSGASPAKT